MPAANQDTSFTKPIFGRHVQLAGDAESVAAGTNGYALLIGESGGGVAATTRAVIVQVATGLAAKGAITITGVLSSPLVGDSIVSVSNLTTPADATSSFEATVSIKGQVQQTSATDLSGSKFLFVIKPQS